MGQSQIQIPATFTKYDTESDLPKDVRHLMSHARQIRLQAYAPYSSFLVGVAMLLDNGKIVTGNNQENASFPSGSCAERTAIYYVGAQYPGAKIQKMCIIAGSINKITDAPIPPCGACRQAISEYEIKQQSPIEIYFMGEEGPIMKSDSLKNLLPLIFDNSAL